jgi:hypothetical protein
MSYRKIATSNTTLLYFIALIVVIAAFFLLGGGLWLKGMNLGARSMGMSNWNWAEILISGGIGFILGLVVSRRRW